MRRPPRWTPQSLRWNMSSRQG